jgi:flagellar biosynthesis protein FliR
VSLADFMAAGWFGVFAALARAGAFAACVPTVAVGMDGIRCRIGLALVLTLVLLPFAQTPDGRISDPGFLILLVQGLAAGCLFGFAIRALLTGIALAAQLVEHQLGFPIVADPDDEATATVVSRLYQLLAIVLFFTFGGHRLVLAGLIDVGPTAVPAISANNSVRFAVGLVSQACWFAVRIAVPLVLALLTTSLIVGMISRVLPQSSVSTIALPAQIAFGLMLIFLSLAAVVPAIRGELAAAFGWLAESH